MNMINKRLLKSPPYIFAYLLSFYTLATLILNFSINNLVFLLTVLVLFVIGTYAIKKINKRLPYVDSIISGLILFLILDPLTPWFEILIIMILFVLLKLLRSKNMPIFNPIVVAIIAYYFLALLLPWINTPFVSCWGTAYMNWVSIVFLLPALLYSLYQFKKYYYFIAIFLSFLIIEALFNGFNEFYLITGTLYFAIGIMFLEIKTSPTKRNDQIIIGVIAGLVLFIFNQMLIPYPILFTILSANLIFYLRKKYLTKLVTNKKTK